MVTLLLLSGYIGSQMHRRLILPVSLSAASGIWLSALVVVLVWGPSPIKTRKAYLLIVTSACILISILGRIFHF